MKNFLKGNSLMVILLLFSTTIFAKVLMSSIIKEDDKLSEYIEVEEIDTLIVEKTTITNKSKLPKNFNYVYDRFSVFNPELDSSTVIVFNNVCDFYKLDTTERLLEWCVGQILLESGAKQYYEMGHPKAGQLVKSYAGATGISQIMTPTAYGYLKKHIKPEEVDCMISLGCTSFDFINDSTMTTKMVEVWLENETNNIILWGYIMRRKLNQRPNILKVLVGYNAGTTGMLRYVKNGGDLFKHDYVKGIKTKLNYAENKLVSS